MVSSQQGDKRRGQSEDDVVSLLLPSTQIANEDDVEVLSETINRSLSHRFEPRHFLAEVSGAFEELAINAVQHSTSTTKLRGRPSAVPERRKHYAHAMIEYSSRKGQGLFSVAVRDFGVGIREAMSIRQSWAYRHDRATRLALVNGRTGTGEERGMGLPHIGEVATSYDGCLILASGVEFSEGALGFEGSRAILRAIDGIIPNNMQGTFVFAGLFYPIVL
jgi:hypothetical protein